MKGEGEKDNGLKGTIPGRQWHNQPHTSFAMSILSSRRHAHLRYHISGTRLPSLAGCPRHDYGRFTSIHIGFSRFQMHYTCMDALCVRHDSRRFASTYRICMYDTDTRKSPYPVQ